ncbi:MAG: XdhC family protein [Deltaproteobacteria bacterium]|nr:XdhC family protein [Deltaproteobacteria bacterium]
MDFRDFDEFLKKAMELNAEGREYVVCTVVRSTGSSPQKPGSRMIVTSEGEFFGTVGGGSVESEVIRRAKVMLKERFLPEILDFELNRPDTGVCGGSMSVFLEGFYRKHKVLIFGAGHVSEAVCDLLKRLGYFITVFDSRKERLNLPSFEGCHKISGNYNEVCKSTEPDANTDILVMTPNHEYDFLVVKQLLRADFRSLGLLGSKRKKAELADFLKREGFSEEEIARVRIPVGIEIGSHTPYEIAVSISAELIQMNSVRR